MTIGVNQEHLAPVSDDGGTSLAAPQVTGVAALHLQFYPATSPQTVADNILAKATYNVLTNVGSGSPNRLLYAKQPPLSALISGPSSVGQGTHCTWHAVHSGGQPPYAFVWRRDGQVVGSADAYSVGPAGILDFALEVAVTDGVGRQTSAYQWISIDPQDETFSC